MKILQIIDSLGTGGAEKLLTDLVPILTQKGMTVDILLLNGENTPFYKELISSQTCRIFSLGSSFYNPFYIIKITPYLKKYDIIHVHLFPAQYYAVLAKLLTYTKCKLIFTEHSTGNKRMAKWYFKGIESFIYSKYDKVVGITQEVCDILNVKLNIPKSKIVKIENGINVEKIANTLAYNRSSFNYSIDSKLLIMVAGFREQKDQDTVIRTLLELPQTYKLLLVGDGQRRHQLESLVNKLELGDRVNFLGVRSDVYSLIKMSDIAVLSSHWEGFGLAAAEAMACGIPVLASNVPGLAQVVEGGGMLFEKTDILDLAEKILKLENQQFYMQQVKKGLEKAQTYSINQMVDKTIELYNNICIS